jgi:hypothetical protein
LSTNEHDRPVQHESDLPGGLSQPARRALAGAGCLRLEQVAEHTEAEIRRLHGMGPKAVEQLRDALRARGLSFAQGEGKRAST